MLYRRVANLTDSRTDEFSQRVLPFFNSIRPLDSPRRNGRRAHATDRTKLYRIDGNSNSFKDL